MAADCCDVESLEIKTIQPPDGESSVPPVSMCLAVGGNFEIGLKIDITIELSMGEAFVARIYCWQMLSHILENVNLPHKSFQLTFRLGK